MFSQQYQPLHTSTHNHFDKHLAAFFSLFIILTLISLTQILKLQSLKKRSQIIPAQMKIVVGVVLVVEEVLSSCFWWFSCPNQISFQLIDLAGDKNHLRSLD